MRACAGNVSFWLAVTKCQIAEQDTSPHYEKCRVKVKLPEGKEKYGGYECKDCMIAGEGVDYGNMDFPDSYKPTDEEKHEIFVPIDVDDILARAGCVSFVHSSFIVVIGFALLALVGGLFCGHMLG
ncbi:hypothetical protein niasHT_017319 [Heterodera trifolii]|uniref:Uncharacterized protein n=1 Tax=Heterodera trifolii TaxID=157864 RepID=A0ABD2L4C7_9BILA